MSQSQTLSRWARIRQSDLVYYFLKDKVAMVCMAVFLGYVALALLSPWIAPHDPYDQAEKKMMKDQHIFCIRSGVFFISKKGCG